jgi:cytochrome c biogenesis protein CcmG/thiol:disulfide interchange protein DsbE
VSPRLAALLLSIAATCVACGGGSSGSPDSGPPVSPNASRSALVAAADLPACPASTSQSASHGLPDVTLACLGNGPAVQLAGLRGTPTVVNVWASWCLPCRPELPYLSALARQLAGKVRVLGVDTDDTDDSALSFAGALKPAMSYPSVADPANKVIDGLAVSPGPPETAFVNGAGTLVHVNAGGYTSLAQLRSDVATYLHVTG